MDIDIGVDSDSDIHTDIDKQPCTYLPLLPLLLEAKEIYDGMVFVSQMLEMYSIL